MWKWGKLELGWGFGALIALALLGGAGPALPPVLLAAACHELGHLAALRLAGARVERLRLNAFGAEIRADTRRLSYPREIACTLAGPAVNRALHLLVSWLWEPLTADAVSRRVGLGCALLLTAAALFLTIRYHAGLFLLLGASGTLIPQLPSIDLKRAAR